MGVGTAVDVDVGAAVGLGVTIGCAVAVGDRTAVVPGGRVTRGGADVGVAVPVPQAANTKLANAVEKNSFWHAARSMVVSIFISDAVCWTSIAVAADDRPFCP